MKKYFPAAAKSRSIYGLAAAIVLGVEVCIGLFVHDRFVRPYVGDVLVTVLLCCLCRCIWTDRRGLVPAGVFLFALGTELLQGLGLARILGLENTLLGVIIGATFDPADILCYFVGCVLFWAVQLACRQAAHVKCR